VDESVELMFERGIWKRPSYMKSSDSS